MTNENTYDCGTGGMCAPCTSTWSGSEPCTGVIGGANTKQVPSGTPPGSKDPFWKYGNHTYNQVFQEKDKLPGCWVDSSKKTMGEWDCTGLCVKKPNPRKMQTTALQVDGETFEKVPNSYTASQEYCSSPDFPLQTLHKIWGDGGDKQFNQGVNSRNVYVTGSKETISYTDPQNPSAAKNLLQRVVALEAHGVNYDGDVPGLKRSGHAPKCKPGSSPSCPAHVSLENGKKVGAIACTRNQYGPGVYNALVYLPKTTDSEKDGRGYVFAMWTFHYEEHYLPSGSQPPTSQYIDPGTAQPGTPCVNQCDIKCGDREWMKKGEGKGWCDASCKAAVNRICDSPPACPEPGKDGICDWGGNTDTFTAVNGEIDLEIPCNSPQLDWKKDMTLDTMNCNTWLNDIDNYDTKGAGSMKENTGAFYTQVAVKNKNASFFSKAKEEDKVKDYHWFTIDWHVENDTPTNNYVAFYYDSPFDPTGATSFNGIKLPKTPKKSPIHRTQRYVPTRAGRLNIGPWFGWWGYGAGQNQNQNQPEFDVATVRLAHLSIVPQQPPGGFDFPQTYDQPSSSCDFVDMYSRGPTPGQGPIIPDTCATDEHRCPNGTCSKAPCGGGNCPSGQVLCLDNKCRTPPCGGKTPPSPHSPHGNSSWWILFVILGLVGAAILVVVWRRKAHSATPGISGSNL